MSTLIHANMLSSLGVDFYPSTCTIQQATESQDAAGQLIRTWANVSGHVDIPCAVASVGGDEREGNETYVLATHRIALRGYYPNITEAMRAVVSGVNYDIERVHHDSQGVSTYLDVQVIT